MHLGFSNFCQKLHSSLFLTYVLLTSSPQERKNKARKKIVKNLQFTLVYPVCTVPTQFSNGFWRTFIKIIPKRSYWVTYWSWEGVHFTGVSYFLKKHRFGPFFGLRNNLQSKLERGKKFEIFFSIEKIFFNIFFNWLDPFISWSWFFSFYKFKVLVFVGLVN